MGGVIITLAVRAIAFVGLLLAIGLLPVQTLAAGEQVCPGFQVVPYQGPSCPVAGGWEVILADGTRVFTHGPDPATPSDDEPVVVGAGQYSPAAPPCVPTTEPHSVVIYALPSNRVDRYNTIKAQLRALINESNGRLRGEASNWGGSASYRFACDEDGLVTIAFGTTGSTTTASFSSITSELRSQGFTSSTAKYWVWWDGSMAGIGGQGTIRSDSSLRANNANLVGPDFALTYGYFSSRIMMHENGHNLGAVQNNAPNTSGGFHCNDGWDVMCYADGGSKSNYVSNVCGGREWYDCNHDDYFNMDPEPGTYLSNHWNLGHIYNTFFDFSNQAPSAPLISCWPSPAQPDQSIVCRFQTVDDSDGVYVDIDWGDGTFGRVPESGMVAPGTLLEKTHAWSDFGTYDVVATATDSEVPAQTSRASSFALRVTCGFERSANVRLGLQGHEIENISMRREAGLPPKCEGHTYSLLASALAEFRVCWNDATGADLGCGGTVGTVPQGAVTARLVLMSGFDGHYYLKVE